MPPIRKPGWAKWLMPVTSARGKERHENSCEFQASMRYSETLSHKNNEEEEVEEDYRRKKEETEEKLEEIWSLSFVITTLERQKQENHE